MNLGASRALRERGEMVETEFCEGDRLLVDTVWRVAVTGETLALWVGGGLMVKRVEPAQADTGAPERRLKSAKPDFADSTCFAEETDIVGKVQ